MCKRSPRTICKLNLLFLLRRADALFNAVKKQYGLHSYLLSITLPTSPLPAPVNVPLPIPRLPPISSMSYSPVPPVQVPNTIQTSASPSPAPPSLPPPLVNGSQDHPRPATSPAPLLAPGNLHLSEDDIQQIARFVREFAVMSLLPWMEKCVIDWNEVVRRRPRAIKDIASIDAFSSIRHRAGCPHDCFHLRDGCSARATTRVRTLRLQPQRMAAIPHCPPSQLDSPRTPQIAPSARSRQYRLSQVGVVALSRSKGGLPSSPQFWATTSLPSVYGRRCARRARAVR